MKKILILGGSRSGKSQFALSLGETLLTQNEKGLFIATAIPFDDEMQKRIEKHKLTRKDCWITIEEPIYISDVIENSSNYRVILIDCLTIWLTNVYLNMNDSMYKMIKKLCKSIENANKNIILISNEIGLGVVPDNKMAREFKDIAGELNQKIAKISHEVYFTIAGIPNRIK